MKRTSILIALAVATLVTTGIVLLWPATAPTPSDPFIRAANGTEKFDPSDALSGNFRLLYRVEQLPLGLQNALWKVRGMDVLPFDPKCVMANQDEPVNSDVMTPGVCTNAQFLLGGINDKAAFVAYVSHNISPTYGVVVFSFAGRGGVWQATLNEASATDLPSLRAAIARKQNGRWGR